MDKKKKKAEEEIDLVDDEDQDSPGENGVQSDDDVVEIQEGRHQWTGPCRAEDIFSCFLLMSSRNSTSSCFLLYLLNPCPAEPGYTLPLQTA